MQCEAQLWGGDGQNYMKDAFSSYLPLLATEEVKINKDFYYSFSPNPSHTSFMSLQQKVSLSKHDLKCAPVKREEQNHTDPEC